jgi:cell division septation protein DedD|tara:strand:+ start:651 stop:1061 length:411 start_codon:yes stop_codon:yes gene_type:complete
MTTERFVGLLFLTGVLVFLIFIYYPESPKINNFFIKEEVSPIKEDKMNDFNEFNESDFDFFVYRAHVLSSKNNAIKLKEKIVDGGYPAFVDNFDNKENLFAVYVGPFLSEDDIVNNMKSIQVLSESNNGEISRWKL